MKTADEYGFKKGDKVFAQGQNAAVFKIMAIHKDVRSADLQQVGTTHSIKNIPLSTLTLSKKKTREDVNQAAARIIREATEKD
jgi:hypothetical protein